MSTSSWTVTHDFAYEVGGAERVTRAIAEDVLDGAPIRYVGGDASVLSLLGLTDAAQLRHGLPVSSRTFQALTPLYPRALGRLAPIEGNVLASSYAFAHHVPCTGAKVVYCHSPLRQVWSGAERYLSEGRLPEVLAIRAFGARLKERDLDAARSAKAYIASGPIVRERIMEVYGLEDVPIVPPPVADVFRPPEHDRRRELEGTGGHYLWVGRITEPYKQLGITLRAFSRLPATRLVVVGDGRDRQRLEAEAPSNVEFVGVLSGGDLAEAYQSARALIFPSEDDFGMVPIEAMASGTPTIAFAAGGALHTVEDGITGLFFGEQGADAIVDAVERFEAARWDRAVIVQRGSRYRMEHFVEQMRRELERVERP